MVEGLFADMMGALTGAVQVMTGLPLLNDPTRGEDLADAVTFLHTRLIQLNAVLYFDYPFEAGLPDDIIQYTALLQEYREPCEEKVDYLLDRHLIFGGNAWDDSQGRHLEEVLRAIIQHSRVITEVLTPYGTSAPSP